MALVIETNIAEGYCKDDSCCATHDFLDANMVMERAFTVLGYTVPLCGEDDQEAAFDAWNVAWSLAKSVAFEQISTEVH